MGDDVFYLMTWDDFLTSFRAEFATVCEVQQLMREFQDLCHTMDMVALITTMFREMALLVQRYVADEEIKKV